MEMFLIAKVKLGIEEHWDDRNSYEQDRDDLRQSQEQRNKLGSDEQSQDRRCCMLL